MRPHIICHMLNSVDGRIDGASLCADMMATYSEHKSCRAWLVLAELQSSDGVVWARPGNSSARGSLYRKLSKSGSHAGSESAIAP